MVYQWSTTFFSEGQWGCLSTLTLSILTLSKVSFSDILRNDYFDTFKNDTFESVWVDRHPPWEKNAEIHSLKKGEKDYLSLKTFPQAQKISKRSPLFSISSKVETKTIFLYYWNIIKLAMTRHKIRHACVGYIKVFFTNLHYWLCFRAFANH